MNEIFLVDIFSVPKSHSSVSREDEKDDLCSPLVGKHLALRPDSKEIEKEKAHPRLKIGLRERTE